MVYTLYKKDSRGKLRVLNMYTEDNILIQETGLLNGKLVINRSTCTGKNAGKRNATTGAQQALKELRSKLNKKKDTGYFESIEELEVIKKKGVMLAHEYEKHKKKVKYLNAYVQPKMDGQRSIGEEVPYVGAVFACLDFEVPASSYKLTSRGNKPILTMSHITKHLKGITEQLDGELYAHGYTFQENMKMIKKYRPGLSEKVDWWVYDLISDEPFYRRYEKLTVIVDGLDKLDIDHNLKLVPTYKVNSYADVLKYHKMFLEQGFEGTILRWGDKPYKIDGRCDSVLKVKDFIDRVATLIDVVPEERRPTMGKGVFEITNDENKVVQFEAQFKGTHEYRGELLRNKDNYIGLASEIRFFDWTDEGIPRHGVCHGFRND